MAGSCVACHGASLEGTPFGVTLKGDVFRSHWQGRTRTEFTTHIRTTMPPRGLGSVSGQAYTDIEAYILQANGHVAVASGSGAPVADPVVSATAPGEQPARWCATTHFAAWRRTIRSIRP